MNKAFFLIIVALISFTRISVGEDVPDFSDKISFAAEPKIFPTKWLDEDVNAKATPIDSTYIDQTKRVLLNALSKYPEIVVNRYLNKVFVLNSMEFYGLRFGGTNSMSNIYLCNRGFSDDWLEMAFHAEFSSLLLRRNNEVFDKQKWTFQNDTTLNYGSSGVEALRGGKTSITFNEELAQKGFLYEYALSSFENDFNSYAENLMMNRSEFWELANKYPRIKAKADLVMQFYKQINEQFNF